MRPNRLIDQRLLGPELPKDRYLVDARLIGDAARRRAAKAVLAVDACRDIEQFALVDAHRILEVRRAMKLVEPFSASKQLLAWP
jgi:uncharacterized SAM-binding protein YcdF (DUF218 family)